MTEAADTFDGAFAEIVAAMEAGTTPPVVETPPETPPVVPEVPPVTPSAPETPPETPPATTPVVPEVPPATPPVVETPPEVPPAAPVPAASQPPAETPEAKTAREAFEASIAPYQPSPEEVAALEQFKKDFPNEALAVEARLKSVDRDINARIHAAVLNLFQQVDSRIKPVEQTVTSSAIEQHVAALHAAHADYDAVIAKVPAWIKTLPGYAQAGAQAVYDKGSTQDVIALVNDYKKATGVPVAAPAPAAPQPSPTPKPKPAGADDLAPVGTRRTAVAPAGTPDPSDFHGAFAEAVAKMA